MKNSKKELISNLFLIIYGVLLFVRISIMDAAERDGFDIFQWILGPVIVIVCVYKIIKNRSKDK